MEIPKIHTNKRTKGYNKMKCEDCIYWENGYCKLRNIETCDGASCEKGELV